MWNPVFSVPLVHGMSPGRWSFLPLTDTEISVPHFPFTEQKLRPCRLSLKFHLLWDLLL